MTLDELLLEWSYRSERGYPSVDNPSDVSILREILKELDLPADEIIDELEGDDDDIEIKVNSDQEDQEDQEEETPELPKQDTEPKDASTTDPLYDAIIRKKLNLGDDEPIPRAKGTYKWPGQGGATFNIQVESEDMKYWNLFWNLTPPKAGAAIGTTSKGSGDGEISLYWLYQHSNSGVEARGTQGSDNPDLEFNGVGVEVKAYGKIAHASAKGLGRFSSDKPQLDALGILFGFQKLIVALVPNEKGKFPADISPSNFHAHQLVGAFETLQKLLDIDDTGELEQLGEIYSLFKDIKTRLDSLKSKIGEWKDPEDGARKMTIYFMSPKVGRKPGDGGFLVNVKDDGDCRFWGFSTEKLINHPDLIKRLPQGGGLVGASNSQMYVSFDKLLG